MGRTGWQSSWKRYSTRYWRHRWRRPWEQIGTSVQTSGRATATAIVRARSTLALALMERVVQGVSTRKVSAITEELCGASFSKSTVSELCVGLDARVKVFNERSLEGEYPFVMVDALFIKSRQGDRVVKRAALIASGIRADGYREILGVQIGDSENYTTWEDRFKWLNAARAFPRNRVA